MNFHDIDTDKTASVDVDTYPIIPNIQYQPKIPEATLARVNALLQFSTIKFWVLVEDTWFEIRRVRPNRNPLWIECLLVEGGAVQVPWCCQFAVRLA